MTPTSADAEKARFGFRRSGSFWLLLCCTSLLFLGGCENEHGKIEITEGVDFSRYDRVYITFEDIWMANHSIVELMVQELERRSYGVAIGEPTEKNSKWMILHLQNSETAKKWLEFWKDNGHLEKLSAIEFLLLDSKTEHQLAFISYTGRNLDRLEQRTVVKKVAEEVFKPRDAEAKSEE